MPEETPILSPRLVRERANFGSLLSKPGSAALVNLSNLSRAAGLPSFSAPLWSTTSPSRHASRRRHAAP